MMTLSGTEIGNPQRGVSISRIAEGPRRPYLIVIVVAVLVGVSGLTYYLMLPPVAPRHDGALVVEMTAYQWGYNVTSAPEEITYERRTHGDLLRIPLGSTIRFVVSAQSELDPVRRQHGFVLSGLGVTQVLEVGSTTEFEVTFSEDGTFSYFCHIYCGLDHANMEGVIVVGA